MTQRGKDPHVLRFHEEGIPNTFLALARGFQGSPELDKFMMAVMDESEKLKPAIDAETPKKMEDLAISVFGKAREIPSLLTGINFRVERVFR